MLEQAKLQKAGLISAKIQNIHLKQANLQKAYLRGANLQESILIETKNLTPKQIKSACFWNRAIYKGKWDKEEQTYIAIEPDNTNYIKRMGIQNYVGRVKESKRTFSRNSNFYVGLYGYSWINFYFNLSDRITQLMNLSPNKRPFYQRDQKAMMLILYAF